MSSTYFIIKSINFRFICEKKDRRCKKEILAICQKSFGAVEPGFFDNSLVLGTGTCASCPLRQEEEL